MVSTRGLRTRARLNVHQHGLGAALVRGSLGLLAPRPTAVASRRLAYYFRHMDAASDLANCDALTILEESRRGEK